MRDLYLEGLLLGPAYPAGREEFVDLVWSLANGERGFRTAREVYRYDTKKSEYYWYSKREEVAVEIGRPRPVSLRGEKALLLFSPSPFPAGSMIRLEDLRDLKGGFTWLEWEPDAKGGINTIKVGSILFSSPSRELVDQEIGPYVESLRRIFLHLASICRPVHALCGEMRIPGPPALEKARKAVARHTIWAIDWINVFGPPYVEKFGKEFLLGAPGHREEAVEGHLIVYQPTKGFFPWEAAEPSPAAVERYFTSHPDIPWVEYRPWLKQALASGDESPGIRSLARAKDERKGRGLFSRLAGEG